MQLVLDYKSTDGLNKTEDGVRFLIYKHRDESIEKHVPTPICEAQNIDIDTTGNISLRKGQTLLKTGSYHSLKSFGDICLLVEGNELKRLYGNFDTLESLYSGIKGRVRYCRTKDDIYFTDMSILGKIENGVYKTLPLPEHGFTKPEIIQHFKITRMNTPAGQLIDIYNNRLLVASGNTLYCSDALAYHRVNRGKGYIQFNGYITLLKAVQDGVFIADSLGIYFLKGSDIKESLKVFKSNINEPISMSKPVLYAVEDLDYKKFKIELTDGKYFVFGSNDGVYLAGDGGFLKNLIPKKYPAIDAKEGCILFRENTKNIFGQTQTVYQIIFIAKQ